jgi:diacylglycerol kinase
MFLSYLLHRIRSFRFAFAGIRDLLASQPHARIHLYASFAVIAVGGYLRLPPHDWCWLIAAMAMVWVAEAFNTALEHLADAAGPQYHPLIGRAKDVAAAAVLLAALAATAIGICILLIPRSA